MNNETYQAALKRNLNELVIAELEFNAYREIVNKLLLLFPDQFFWIAQVALFNDMMSHMIKVLDQNSQSATFWYIFRCESEEAKKFIKKESIDFMDIYDITEKLKIVRDGTHFHIDKKGVRKPEAIWSRAGLTYDDLQKNLDSIYRILNHLHMKEFGSGYPKPQIDNLSFIIEELAEKGFVTKRSYRKSSTTERP